MNSMEEVARLLGIKLGEHFKIKFGMHGKTKEPEEYVLTESGLKHRYSKDSKGYMKSSALQGLLTGYHKVVKLK